MWTFLAGLIPGLLLAGIFYFRWEKQKRQIRRLNSEIDEILHGNTRLELAHFQEGEIEVLRDEIYKMTVRLREQAEHLKEDKKELADSLADISHQMRTPLTSLNLMCARLSALVRNRQLEQIPEEIPREQSEMISGEIRYRQEKQLLRDMQQMLDRIDWLVTSLLKMSKLDAGTIAFNIEEINVRELVNQAVAPFQIAAEVREIAITQNGREDTAFPGDMAWTLEAVGNVLKNCLEYTPDQGRIEISWEENPLYVQIAVKDSGHGIAQEDLRHLFERFYRGKNAGTSGFGIGLSLAQMIVSRQNGVIRAENCPEGGSRFTIRFHKGTV